MAEEVLGEVIVVVIGEEDEVLGEEGVEGGVLEDWKHTWSLEYMLARTLREDFRHEAMI